MTAMPSGPKRATDHESYRESLARAVELKQEIADTMKLAAASGDMRRVERSLDEMEQRIDNLDQLRMRMTERDRFIARFKIETPHDGMVSLVIPEGATRIGIVQQAEAISQNLWRKGVVWGPVLRRWERMPEFHSPLPHTEAMLLKGHVEGTEGKPAADQASILAFWGLEPVAPWELAVAHAAYAVARNDNIFGWLTQGVSFSARTIYGSLTLEPFGLSDISLSPPLPSDRVMMPGKLLKRY